MKLTELLKADLHMHTKYSMDCDTPLEEIISRCQQTGINCIAIADHGTIEGALKLQSMAPFLVIVAEEILTPDGEIMAMFLKDGIPSGLSVHETISRIKNQGALVCIPHPFDVFRPSALSIKVVEEILGQIDVMEVFNSRNLFQSSVRAQIFARQHSIPGSAGSDAHTPSEIGRAYVEMPVFNDRDDFLNALTKAKLCGRKTNPLVHFGSILVRLKNRL